MLKINYADTRKWHKKYKKLNYNPKLIFNDFESKFDLLFSFSFFLMIMASEILLNQPVKKNIKIIHNNFLYKFFNKDHKRNERIEINSFSFSLFLIMYKLLREEEVFDNKETELISCALCHWASLGKLNEDEYSEKLNTTLEFWSKYKTLILSGTDEVKIDLIILLYKSFEIGVADKEIIKKNIATLGFSISKVFKEFRYDVIKYYKEKTKKKFT